MEDLDIIVDENNYETGIKKILEIIRSNWKYSDIKFKVSESLVIKEISDEMCGNLDRNILFYNYFD